MLVFLFTVLHFLRRAYYDHSYYSHLGAGTVLAVNPFHEVKGLFSDEVGKFIFVAKHHDCRSCENGAVLPA